MINMACRHKKAKAKKIIKSLTLYVCEAHYSLYQSVEGVASRPTKSGGGAVIRQPKTRTYALSFLTVVCTDLSDIIGPKMRPPI